MKRSFATFLFVFYALFTFAQSNENKTEHKYYCEVKTYEKGLKSNYKVVFDFGPSVSNNLWKRSSYKVKFVNEKGKNIKFKSIIDAANFMSERGWELQEAYSSQHTSNKSIKHWIFFKNANTLDEVKEGFVTKKEFIKAKKASKKAKETKKSK